MAGCHSFPMHTSLALSCSSFISTHGRGNSNNLAPRGILSSLRPNVEVVDFRFAKQSEGRDDALVRLAEDSIPHFFQNPFFKPMLRPQLADHMNRLSLNKSSDPAKMWP